jgi:hypothetical protein
MLSRVISLLFAMALCEVPLLRCRMVPSRHAQESERFFSTGDRNRPELARTTIRHTTRTQQQSAPGFRNRSEGAQLPVADKALVIWSVRLRPVC